MRFPYAIRAIEQLTPKAFVFENVKGLLRPSFADYFEYIILRLTYPGFIAKPDADWKGHLSDLRSIGQLADDATGVAGIVGLRSGRRMEPLILETPPKRQCPPLFLTGVSLITSGRISIWQKANIATLR